jgi:hypothetical protein
MVLQRKKTAFELDEMETICYVPSSAICATFKTSSRNFQGAILEMNSLKCAYVGPIWMLCGHGRPARWKVIVKGKHVRRDAEAFGVNHQWDRVTGPYQGEDTWGMFEAAAILLRSLDPGRKSKFIQHDTMWKLRGNFPSRYKCEAHFSLMDISDDIGGTFYTDQPRFGLWSKHFSQGVHSRMGNNPRPTRSVTLDKMQCIQVLLEEDWRSHIGTGHVTRQLVVVATNALVYLSGYSASLCGEEIPKADIGGTSEHRFASVNHRHHPHITLALKGRVKGETADRCHLLPLAITTASRLRNGLWIQRLLGTLAMKGITMGQLIRCNRGGRWVRAKIVDLDPRFHDYLRMVKVRWKDVIPAGEDPCKLSSIY